MTVPTITLNDGQVVRLGRTAPKKIIDVGRFRYIVKDDNSQVVVPRLSYFYDRADDVAAPPDTIDYSQKAMASVKRMYKNDALGDCCLAMVWHSIGVWTANETTEVQATDAEVVKGYHDTCGGGDNGCIVVDVMDQWKRGYQGGGGNHIIDDYVAVDHTNKLLVQVAQDLFGALQIAASLPSGWTQTNTVWDDRSSGMVGGHCFPGLGYGANLHDAKGSPFSADGICCSTWAGLVLITWPAFQSRKWVEEVYAPLAPDWYQANNLAPNGVDVTALRAALTAIRNGQIPPLPQQVVDWTGIV
jgi:hypothetical protein